MKIVRIITLAALAGTLTACNCNKKEKDDSEKENITVVEENITIIEAQESEGNVKKDTEATHNSTKKAAATSTEATKKHTFHHRFEHIHGYKLKNTVKLKSIFDFQVATNKTEFDKYYTVDKNAKTVDPLDFTSYDVAVIMEPINESKDIVVEHYNVKDKVLYVTFNTQPAIEKTGKIVMFKIPKSINAIEFIKDHGDVTKVTITK